MSLPRALVLYATTDGHTRKIALALAEPMRLQGLDVDVVNVRGRFDPNPEDYAGVVVAASVHSGRFARAVSQWARSHAPALRARPTAFVTVCLAVLEKSEKADADIARIMRQLFEDTGWTPGMTAVMPGALLYTRYNWLVRWMMRRIVAKANGDTDTSRDYEYTNWNEVRAFGLEFARRITPAAGRSVETVADADVLLKLAG
jgi:menaquinone-dependent protoporphyrinogen oxidase